MKTLCFIVILSLCAFEGLSQSDYYVSLKNNYDRLRKENKQDSALMIAREMNIWALRNKGDISLQYAVSLRFIGNCYFSKENFDSAGFYYKKSLAIFENKKDSISIESAAINLDIGMIYCLSAQYDIAFEKINKAITITKNDEKEGKIIYSESLYYLGKIKSELSDFQEAEKYLLMCIIK